MKLRLEIDPFELAVLAAILVYLIILLGRHLSKPRYSLGISIGGKLMDSNNFTVKGGAIYPIVLVPLLNGNPDGEAVVNSSSVSGDPRVRQLTGATIVFDGSTAPAGTWALDLTVSSDSEVVIVQASENVTYADLKTRDVGSQGTVTVGEESSNTYGLGMQIGPVPATPPPGP